MAENEKELIALIRGSSNPEKLLAVAVRLIRALLAGATEEELWGMVRVHNVGA